MTICRAGDRLKTVPRSADTTWILIFLPGQGGTKWATFGAETGQKGVLVGLITH